MPAIAQVSVAWCFDGIWKLPIWISISFNCRYVRRLLIPLAKIMSHVSDSSDESRLNDFNDTKKIMYQAIHRQFEQQVEMTPEVIAVQWGDESFSYEELNRRANQIARCLRAKRHHSDGLLVGLCVERSFELIAAVFGILKAGGAYLPLDPTYPQDRLTLMIEDAEPDIILTQQSVKASLPPSSVESVCLDEAANFAELDVSNLPEEVEADSLAYIIYTSGSTGRPKGVMIEQGALSSFVRSATQVYGIEASDRVLQFASISFDVAAEEIYPCLVAGGTLVLQTPDMMSSISTFLRICGDRGVTILDLPTAFWHVMVAELCADPEMQVPSGIRSIIFGGEAVNGERVRQWQQRFAADDHKIQLINAYGPTETTVDAIVYPIPQHASPSETASHSIPIGKPLPNVTAYVLDEQHKQLEVGKEGELYIGGPHLARGYLHRADLTAERFIANPFGEGRLYKTGDWCRISPDGNIEYLGRIDSQVKLRGFRVELGEIEAVLLEQPGVQEAVVVVNCDASEQQRLVAYMVMAASDCFDELRLRDVLQSKLPHYMVPSAFVELDALPLTPSDKVNRKTLAALSISLEVANSEAGASGEQPESPLEIALAEMWQSTLVASIGDRALSLDDNFFDVGGTSLIAMQLFAQIEKAFDQRLQLSTLFEAPTIRKLAQYLDGQRDPGQIIRSVIPLKTEGHRPPFFFLNSGAYARQFVPLLSDAQPLYNLNIFNISERLSTTLESLSVSKIAEIFVADMKSVQPQGPYYIGGFCDDSKLAVEMADQLQSDGETVALVVMIDPSWDELVERSGLRLHVDNFLKLGPQYLLEKVKDIWANLYQPPEAEVRVQLGASLPSEANSGLASQAVEDSSPMRVGQGEVSLLHKYQNLCLNFQPRPYTGQVAILFSQEAASEPRDLLVSTLKAGFEEYVIPGLHLTIFENPTLRQQLVDAIEKAIGKRLESTGDESNVISTMSLEKS